MDPGFSPADLRHGGVPPLKTALAALLLLSLPLLQPLRGDLAYLVRKAYPRSLASCLLAMLRGYPLPARWRFSVTDAGLALAAAMIVVTLAGSAAHDDARRLIAPGLGLSVLLLILFDMRYRVLPDGLTLPVAALGVVAAPACGVSLWSALIGLAGAGGGMWLVGAGFRHFRGIDGLGMGDVKLAAAMGAWLGPIGCANAIALATLGALAVETAIGLYRRRGIEPRKRIPLGAYLGAAFWLTWCFGLPV